MPPESSNAAGAGGPLASSGQLFNLAGLRAWADERFPIVATALLLAVVYLSAVLYGRALTHDGALELSAADLGGLLAAWSFFLMMRVLDEHKDYERDCVLHPDRVLQRGLVTLRQLRVLGFAAVAIQAIVSLSMDGGIGPVTTWWLITIAWVALTAREFFLGSWLSGRLVLYTAVHLPIWSLAVLWMAQTGARPEWLPLAAIWVALLGFILTSTVDLARKSAPSELEPTGSSSYADVLGARGVALALGATLSAGSAIVAIALRAAGEGSVVADVVLALLLVPAGVAFASYARNPLDERANRRLRRSARLVLLAQLGVLSATLCAGRGIA